MRRGFCYLLIISFIIGCASSQQRRKGIAEIFDLLVGKMTYDHAISQWGPPLDIVEGDKIFVAVWGYEDEKIVSANTGYLYLRKKVKHGNRLLLTFDNRTRKLVAWKYDEW